jgi:nucleotide-binding universal stress UspA family protein
MSNRSAHQGIVVGVDGSPSSDMAVRWAAREAVMRNVPISLIHVIDTPPSGLLALGGGAVPPPSGTSDWQKTEGEKLISAAVELAKDSAQNGALPHLAVEVYYAAAGPALVDLSKEAQLIVVGCRGQSKVSRVLLGSVSTGLIRHSLCPVAVIHDETRVASEPSQLPVVVGIDGSPASELATAIAFDEASWRGVELVALHAWSDAHMSEIPSMEWSAQQPVGEEALAERLAGWRERYPDVAVRRRIVLDAPARHLLEEAESSQLLVVGSHGRGGFFGMLLGSVSTAVVQGPRTGDCRPAAVIQRQKSVPLTSFWRFQAWAASPLGRIAGFPVQVNWSVLVVLWLFTWSLASTLPTTAGGYSAGAYWVAGACGATVLLASLLAHELAHAIVARRAHNLAEMRRIAEDIGGSLTVETVPE